MRFCQSSIFNSCQWWPVHMKKAQRVYIVCRISTFSGRWCHCVIRNSYSASCGTTCRFDQPHISIVSMSSCFLQACSSFRLLSRQYAFNLSTLLFTRQSRSFSHGKPANAPRLMRANVFFAVISFTRTVVSATWPTGKLALDVALTVATRHTRCFASQNSIHVYCAIIMTSSWRGLFLC